MRLSAKPNSAGNLLHELLIQAGRCPAIYVNGIKQDMCITADDAEGWIERCVCHPDGSLKRDRTGDLVIEKVFGKVTILLDPGGR